MCSKARVPRNSGEHQQLEIEEEPRKENEKKKSISFESRALEMKGEVSFRKKGKVTRDKVVKKATKIRLEKRYCSSTVSGISNLFS